MHKAADEDHKEVAELLIAEGADVNAKTRHGQTPLNLAIQLKQTNRNRRPPPQTRSQDG